MKMLTLARRALLALLLCCSASASATVLTPNFGDLWWIPSEPGWGLNISQQADVIFFTLFVYGPNGQPVWYSATMGLQTPQSGSTYVFTGDLYQTTGPFFGLPFNPSGVVLRKVGTVRFESSVATNATLLYTVDGTSVTKQIERQTLRANSLAGTYLGGTSDVTFNCSNPTRNGLRTEDPGPISIVQSGSPIVITTPTCVFAGAYTQHGQVGRIDNGTYNCTNNASGSITFTDMYAEQSGFVGKYSGQDSACSFQGNIGGGRRK